MAEHHLKCGDEYIMQMWLGEKKAEFRLLDRDYQVDDKLILTGTEWRLDVQVTCVTPLTAETLKQFWNHVECNADFVMLSIRLMALERLK